MRSIEVISLFVGGSPQIGGAERQYLLTAPRLREFGVASSVLILRPNATFAEACRDLGVPVVGPEPSSGLGTDVVRALPFLRSCEADVLHVYGLRAEIWARPFARAATRMRVVSAIRGVETHRTKRQVMLSRWTSRWVDLWISNTEAGARAAIEREGALESRMRVVRNAVDPRLLEFDLESERATMRSALGLTDGDFVVGMVANHAPVKRHVDVIDMVRALRDGDERAFLVLVGREGPTTKSIRSRVESAHLEDRVIDLGFRTDVPACLAAMDVVVSASTEEGMSNSVLEAQALGRPVVATRVGGTVEIVEDGVSGLLVAPSNVEQGRAALERLRGDEGLRRRLGAVARERVARDHGLGPVCERIAACYREVIETERG